jgi:RNA polymerase sigma-70 factor (ECF subfamily)
MDRLETDERTILNLFYFEDLPVEEIASIMDLSSSNVKVKLFRSRKKLYGHMHGIMKSEEILL